MVFNYVQFSCPMIFPRGHKEVSICLRWDTKSPKRSIKVRDGEPMSLLGILIELWVTHYQKSPLPQNNSGVYRCTIKDILPPANLPPPIYSIGP